MRDGEEVAGMIRLLRLVFLFHDSAIFSARVGAVGQPIPRKLLAGDRSQRSERSAPCDPTCEQYEIVKL